MKGSPSERIAVNGTDAKDCGEGNGGAGMGWVLAKLRSATVSREVGMGGGDVTGVVGSKTGEFKVNEKTVCIVESG